MAETTEIDWPGGPGRLAGRLGDATMAVRACEPCSSVRAVSAVRAGHRRAATKNLENRTNFDRKSSVEAAGGHSTVGFESRGRSVERLGATRGDFG